jgi:hypothetical protein
VALPIAGRAQRTTASHTGNTTSASTTNTAIRAKAIAFNDALVLVVDTLYEMGKGWGDRFVALRTSQKFSELAPYRARLEKYVDGKIVYLQNMKDVSNSKDLRMALIGFLQFERQMIKSGFMQFEKFGPNDPAADVDAAMDKLTEDSKKEGERLKQYAQLQEAYAKANGFTIDKPEEE